MEEPAKKQPTALAASVAPAKTTLKTLLDAFAAMEEEQPPTSEKQRLPGAVAVAVAVSRASSVASSARRIKRPTTLLDAYELDCIRRELESLILRHNAAGVAGGAAAKKEAVESDDAKSDRHRCHHHHRSSSSKTTSAAKNAKPAAQAPPPTPAKKAPSGGAGVRLLGRHAVAVCGVSVPVPVSVAAAAGGRRRRRGGGHRREVEKV